ncbi:growth factor receptor-bound protein 14 isoform X1 [Microplitis demolitor]|uniref:growth factor receptor-bound protein 14 isoform X1 n=2 Tax=Microplitis demolitor TaxID=69319 RepID=UPI00235B5EBC|nr:growth factor receptor-bound protein 14 isoform X1 [Microplitis demolitor]XP_053599120.1 growth factor receptor-bound protein 14 isoform X1 [Microplitis demolitor]XP_053599124.1 growth factor receptor-bound protein 14 isoform X1 [Microplitis demolitor]
MAEIYRDTVGFESIPSASTNTSTISMNFENDCNEISIVNKKKPKIMTSAELGTNIFYHMKKITRLCFNWIPKMCECFHNVSVTFPMTTPDLSFRTWGYTPLDKTSTRNRFRDFMRRDGGYRLIEDHDKEIEMTFHNIDKSYSIVEVEKDLRVDNLCELLRIKNQFEPGDWRIVETWPKLEIVIERVLENHEDIYAVHRDGEKLDGSEERKFYFMEVSDDIWKYTNNPAGGFPRHMILRTKSQESLGPGELFWDRATRIAETHPIFYEVLWVAENNMNGWKKVGVLLMDRKLYLIERTDFMEAEEILNDENERILFAHLSDCQIYKIPNTKKLFNAPFQWGACLRPSSNAEAEDTEAGVSGLKVIGFNTEKSHTCWHQAMRLAKYGKQLKDNYRAFKNKNDPASSGRPFNVTPSEPPILVAMDFSGKYGKIVEDPKEAKAITEGKGMLPQPQLRPPASRLQVHNYPRVDPSRYFNEDWYHMTIGRESAARLVKLARKNGTFLVRESTSNNGYQFVLTYIHEDKPVHTPIITRETSSQPIFTLDNGTTKFLDLVQLVNFYQLNQGSLPTRLTYFVSKNTSKLSPAKNNGVSTTTTTTAATTSPLSKNRNSPQKISEESSRLPRS